MATHAGLYLDPWQCLCLRESLGQRSNGKWAAFEVGLVVPRQNGKGGVIEARELAGLFVFKERLIMHSAHEFKTAAEAFLRIKALIQDTPDLDELVAHYRTAHGDEAIELKDGRRLRFVARSNGSGRGFTGDCLILDEAYNLSASSMQALLYILSARPNTQIWYTSSAPLPSSSQLKAVRKRGSSQSAQRLAYLEWSAEPGSDTRAVATWAQANPGLGIRIELEAIENELNASSEDIPGFMRERLGIVPGDDGGGGEIDLAVWVELTRCHEGCEVEHEHEYDGIEGVPILGLDVNEAGTWSCFSAFGATDEGDSFVETVDRRADTDWVVARGTELHTEWGSPIVIDPQSPAGRFIKPLTKAGVPVIEVTQRQIARACGTFVALVKARRVFHPNQPSMLNAIAGAGKRHIKKIWVWNQTSDAVDITALQAATLAIAATETDVDEPAESVYEEREMRVLG